MGGGLRAFWALDLADETRAAVGELLRRLRARPHADRVRWVRPEALHVTVRFLGTIGPEQVAVLAHHVGREAAGLAPFALELGAPRPFPSERRPRVVALDTAPAAPLAELAAAVERGVVAAGLAPEERPFRGHLTLGRLRGRRAPDTGDLAPPAAPSPVREVVLYRSHLGEGAGGGSRYEALERVPLGAGADDPPGADEPPRADDSPRTHVQGEQQHGQGKRNDDR